MSTDRSNLSWLELVKVSIEMEEASTLAEHCRRLEMVQENRVAVQISYHVQETLSYHLKRLVNQMTEVTHWEL